MSSWSILAHRLSTGLFSGMSLSVSLMAVPAVRNTSDPLPAWKAVYENGKNFALISTFTTIGCGIYNYYQTGNQIYLLSSGLQFVIIPFTIFAMGPGIKKLYTLDKKDDKEIRLEVEGWSKLHWFRTFCGLSAFLTVLMSNNLDFTFGSSSEL